MTQQSLTTIRFHDADLIAVAGDRPETTLVAMKPVVEGMGLAWQPQHAKIMAHMVLGACVTKIMMQMPDDNQGREHVFMPLNRLTLWLATIQPNKVTPVLRDKVIAYQTECADVLFAHFFGQPIGNPIHRAEDDHAIAELARGMVSKALAPIAEDNAAIRGEIARLQTSLQRVIDGFDPTQNVITDHKPMLDILKDEGVEPKNRRRLSQRCSRLLARWCVDNGRSRALRSSRETGRYLFQIDAAKDWLRAEGRALIIAHKARVSGQGVLQLVPRKEARAEPPAAASESLPEPA
jgi:hypothetical protein